MYDSTRTFIIRNETNNAFGIASFVFGLISIFFLAPLFVPLSILFAILAVVRKQLAWALIGLICAFIGFLTSPILLGLAGVAGVASIANHNHIASGAVIAYPSQRQVEHPLAEQQSVSLHQQLAERIRQAGKEAAGAAFECMNKRLSGELKTHVESVNCSNPKYIEAFQNAGYPYMDLINGLTAKRLDVAEKEDADKITESQRTLEVKEFIVDINNIEKQRNLQNRNQ